MDISHTVSQMYCWIDIWVTVSAHFKRISKREREGRGERRKEKEIKERGVIQVGAFWKLNQGLAKKE